MFDLEVEVEIEGIKKVLIHDVESYEANQDGITITRAYVFYPTIPPWGKVEFHKSKTEFTGNITSIKKIKKGEFVDISGLKPCQKYLGSSIEQQTLKLAEELAEVVYANTHETTEKVLEETIDVIQAGITSLEIFRRIGFDVKAAIQKVVEKNNAQDRKYYTKENK